MRYAVLILAASVAAVMVYGVAHAFYDVMRTIATAFGGAA